MTEAQKLLLDYVDNASEAAFRELVTRYVDLVYSTALRLVGGDSHLAEDVTQTVFVHLARNASTLGAEGLIGGWLHRDACFVASKMLRGERRRQIRESEAALMNSEQDHSKANLESVAPLLDEAIDHLGEEDRTAILLRFFEQRDFRSIAQSLGSSEDAARMRVNRALEKLHSMLKLRGVTMTAAALSAVLAGEAVSAAPIGLAMGVAGKVLAGSAVASGASLLKLMAITKVKTGILSGIIVATLGTSLVLQYRSMDKLREENEALQVQYRELAQLPQENQNLSNLLALVKGPSLSASELSELAGLRNTVGRQRSTVIKLRSQLVAKRNLVESQKKAAKQYFPREAWASAGNETPEGAEQQFFNFFSANRDRKSAMANMPPVMSAELKALLMKDYESKPESEVDLDIAKAYSDVQKIDGIRIVNIEPSTNDQVFVTSLQFINGGTDWHWDRGQVKHVGNEWKFGP